MRLDKIVFGITIAALFLFTGSSSSIEPDGVLLRLFDSVSRDKTSVYLFPGFIRCENMREAKIAKNGDKAIFHINKANATFFRNDYSEIERARALHAKYNDSEYREGNDGAKIKILSVSTRNASNRPYPIAVVRYLSYQSKSINSTMVASFNALKDLFLRAGKGLDPGALLDPYLSREEVELLKSGFVPVRSSKGFELASISTRPIDNSLLSPPKNFREKGSGDYYKEMVIQFISDGSPKKRR